MIDFQDFTENPMRGIVALAESYAQLLFDGAGWSSYSLGLHDLSGVTRPGLIMPSSLWGDIEWGEGRN